MKAEESYYIDRVMTIWLKGLTPGFLRLKDQETFPLLQAAQVPYLVFWTERGDKSNVRLPNNVPVALGGTNPPKCHRPGTERIRGAALLRIRAELGFFQIITFIYSLLNGTKGEEEETLKLL